MSVIIDLTLVKAAEVGKAKNYDTFLVQEGLELLRKFESIKDADIRKALLQIIKKLSLNDTLDR